MQKTVSSPASRVGRTFFNLLLALVNATLILVAICLYLELRVVQKMDNITATISQNLVTVEPLKDAVLTLSQDVTELRSELKLLRETPGKLSEAAGDKLSLKVEKLSSQLTLVRDKFGTVMQDPDVLIDRVVDKGAQAFVQGVADLRGCSLPSNL